MTIADFLLFLGKLNLAIGAAIILVYVLRRPLRASFGAPIAYAIWLLVPIVGLAILLPPRVAPPPAHGMAAQYLAAPMSAIRQIARPALRITEQLTGQSAPVHPVVAAQAAAASGYGTPDYAMLLFALWLLGAALMAICLARLQARFHAAARLGKAGPAVLGFLRPRIVTPDTFGEQFTAAEQAAILAHERVHLARQDARINALAALLRCLCWFNPLVHLGAAWLRIDQELACDATAIAGPISRRSYAQALLKSQIKMPALPLGCNWPGSQHPLIERVALLKRNRPGTARRITGTGLVIVAATFAGLGAWAAQPPVAAGSIAVPHYINQIALVSPPAMKPAPGQNAGGDPSQPSADSNQNGRGHEVDTSNDVHGGNAAASSPADAQMPNTASARAQPESAIAGEGQLGTPSAAGQTQDSNSISAGQAAQLPSKALAQPLSKETSAPATAISSNDPPAAPAPPATPGSSAGQVAAETPASAGSDPVSPLQAHPGTEASLRRYIESLEKGRPNYDEMAPDQADAVKRQLPPILAMIKLWGGLQSIVFTGVSPLGLDSYDVTFEHGKAAWYIAPLNADGKVVRRGYLTVSPW